MIFSRTFLQSKLNMSRKVESRRFLIFFFAGFAYFCQTFVSKQSFETWGRTDKKQIVEFSLCLFDFKLFNRVARHYAVRE